LSEIFDFSTGEKIGLPPDDNLKNVVRALEGLLAKAQQGGISGFIFGALLPDGTSRVFIAGEACDGICGVGLATHSANVISKIMLESTEKT
jgi:hypothetical protein